MQSDGMQDEPSAMAPLDPAHATVLRMRTGLIFLVLALAAAIADLGPLRLTPIPAGLALGLVLLAGVAATLIFPGRRYRAWGYREGGDEIEIRRGRLIRVRTIVPYARVQHIDVAQGPIQRAFGLGTLILHTAGTHGASVPLPGLAYGDAERMRDRIRARIRQDLV